MLAGDVVLQAAVALPTDGAELPLSSVHQLVSAQVHRLREAFPAGAAPMRPYVLVHGLVACQVAGVEEALPAHVADEGLVKVREAVSFEHADAGETLPADVTVAGLLTCVPGLHVQVAVSFVVKRLRAEVTAER